jgi:hypothetical protein
MEPQTRAAPSFAGFGGIAQPALATTRAAVRTRLPGDCEAVATRSSHHYLE